MNTDPNDFWMQEHRASNDSRGPHITVEKLGGIEPLDGQFGINPPKCVPDLLHQLLFEKEGVAESAPAHRPLLHTYAILDAAKIEGLAEVLAVSGLEHSCLFQGQAFDELKDVAPWIVRLEDGNSLTRNLFTRSDAPWHLWDEEAGIFLRSEADLDVLRSHFRRYTRVKDVHGAWFYMRFWEPKWALPLILGMTKEDAQGFLTHISELVVLRASCEVSVVRLLQEGDRQNGASGDVKESADLARSFQ